MKPHKVNKSRAWIVEIYNPAWEDRPATWRIIRTNNDRRPEIRRRDRMVLHIAIAALQKIADKLSGHDCTFRLRNVKNPDTPMIMGDILLNEPRIPGGVGD